MTSKFAAAALVGVLSVWGLSAGSARADKPSGTSEQTLQLPSGASSLKGLGESFEVSASTGTGSFDIPLWTPEARLAPKLKLVYAAGSGKSELGVNFRLPILSIYRTTDKGSPAFDENDRFAVSSDGLNDELVLVDAARRFYRLKNEGAFALFERRVSTDSWLVHLASGHTITVGDAVTARQSSLGHSMRWFVTRETDLSGEQALYQYVSDLGRVYLVQIDYQLRAAADYQNHVRFEYEPRHDVFTDYSSGDAITTAQRMSAVVVSQGTRALRRYTLSYEEDQLLSLLARVDVVGERGSALPSMRISYQPADAQNSRFVQMRQLPPLDGLLNATATLSDMNGDALPDLLYGVKGHYYYYENLDGLSWARTRTQLTGSPDRSLSDPDVVLADIDGDGQRDLVHTQGNGFRYFPAGRVQRGVFPGYQPPLLLPSDAGNLDFSSSFARVLDLNHDGRTDLLVQKPGGFVQLINDRGQRMRSASIPALPTDVDLSDARVQLLDFNGDGVLDFVRKELGTDRSRVRVFYGLGGGRYASEQLMAGVPRIDASEGFFADVNHDGQADLVRVSGSWAAYQLNDGKGGFGPQLGSTYSLPSVNRTRKLLFEDMNGNGTSDIVWLTTDGKLYYLDLVGDAVSGLVTGLDNGMGLITELAYQSSTDFAVSAKLQGEPWSTTLPHAVQVVSELRTSDSLDTLGIASPATVVSYSYADGYYDAREREFRGFGRVLKTEWGDADHATLVTETRFHLGRDFDTGVDHEVLKGKARLITQSDDTGALFASMEQVWEPRWLCQAADGPRLMLPQCDPNVEPTEGEKDQRVAFAAATRELRAAWEKTSTPRFMASQKTYDSFGQVVAADQLGEVKLAAPYTPGAGFDIADSKVGNDEARSETDYLNRIEPWLIGLPYATRSLDGKGNVIDKRRIFYDAPYADQLGLDPSDVRNVNTGHVTLTQRWLDDDTQHWVTEERADFDAFGRVLWKETATGIRTVFEHESQAGFFVSGERTTMSDEQGTFELAVQASYDVGLGVLTSLTDANGRKSRAEYDDLARVERLFDSEGNLTLEVAYAFGAPLSRTEAHALADEATQKYVTSVQYSDGAGRVREQKREAEAPHGYIASGFARLSARGAAVSEYEPFATATLDFEAAPDSAEKVRTQYDGLGRVTGKWAPTSREIARQFSVSTPFTQTSLLSYEPLLEKSFSERDLLEGSRAYPTVSERDGLGRLRSVARSNVGPNGLALLRWSMEYDALGRITALVDAAQTRHYEYDSLGRMRTLHDQNLGTLRYRYDDQGRLLQRDDDLSQVQTWTYDASGRVLEQASRYGDGTEGPRYRFHYDRPSPLFAQQTGAPQHDLLGRLSWAEFPTGRTYFSYDTAGRANVEVSELWNPELPGSSFTQQARETFVRRLAHDAAGKLTAVSEGDRASTPDFDGARFAFAYNARSLVTDVWGGFAGREGNVFSGVGYLPSGQVYATDQANGLRTCRGYDARRLIEHQVSGKRGELDCGALSESGGRSIVNLAYRFTYDNQLGAIDDLSAFVKNVPRLGAQFEYDRVGQLISAEYEDSAFGTQHFAYDGMQNLITRISDAHGSEPLRSEHFVYGEGAFPAPQRLSSIVEGDLITSFDSDAIGQLTRYRGYRLHYDPAGNLSSAIHPTGERLEYYYDGEGLRRQTVLRNADGSVRSSERVVSDSFLIRDGEQLIKVSAGLGHAEIALSTGLRIDASLLSELETYVAQGGRPSGLKQPLPSEYMDLDGDGSQDFDQSDLNLARAAVVSEQRAGGTRSYTRFMHLDHLGTATHETDSQGALIAQQTLDAWGAPLAHSGITPLIGFAGKRRDLRDLGLVHMGRRVYAPELARFITPDRHLGESPQQLVGTLIETNLYLYARNNPVLLVDPNGTKVPSVDEILQEVGDKVEQVVVDAVHDLELEAKRRVETEVQRYASDVLHGVSGSYKFSTRSAWKIDRLKKIADAEANVSFGGTVQIDASGKVTFTGSLTAGARIKLPAGPLGSKPVFEFVGGGQLSYGKSRDSCASWEAAISLKLSGGLRWETPSIGPSMEGESESAKRNAIYAKAFVEVGAYGGIKLMWSSKNSWDWDAGLFARGVAEGGIPKFHFRRELSGNWSLHKALQNDTESHGFGRY